MTILQFINTVRVAGGLAPAIAFDVSSGHRGSEAGCIVALALGCEIRGASHPGLDDGAPQLTMRFRSIEVAQRVAAATGCTWCEPLPAVLLPDALADIAVGFDDGDDVDPADWRHQRLIDYASVAA